MSPSKGTVWDRQRPPSPHSPPCPLCTKSKAAGDAVLRTGTVWIRDGRFRGPGQLAFHAPAFCGWSREMPPGSPSLPGAGSRLTGESRPERPVSPPHHARSRLLRRARSTQRPREGAGKTGAPPGGQGASARRAPPRASPTHRPREPGPAQTTPPPPPRFLNPPAFCTLACKLRALGKVTRAPIAASQSSSGHYIYLCLPRPAPVDPDFGLIADGVFSPLSPGLPPPTNATGASVCGGGEGARGFRA